MRGKARLRWPRCRRGGIIPAGAGKRHRVFQARAFRGDHPRGCGEKPIDIQISNLREGSSPRVRGKASSARPSGFSTWIIPAGAGKRTTSFHVSPEAWDHPRGCGEKSEAREEYCPALGSSPRVRGKVSVSTLRVYLRGIIPAGAGKSMAFGVDDAIIGDHPRGCGEKPRALARARHRQGSSPRVRGKGKNCKREIGGGGIIPAGAGKRPSGRQVGQADRDHPRGCGEKEGIGDALGRGRGSSPRVRGKGLAERKWSGAIGIIPAGAGKSRGGAPWKGASWDHPRGCGEKGFGVCVAGWRGGSSPRVRGKGGAVDDACAPGGIIPAGAGKRPPPQHPSNPSKDHPRGCGEKGALLGFGLAIEGSSPRVRGKANGIRLPLAITGIIPAGAGKSGALRRLDHRRWDHPRGCGEKTFWAADSSAGVGSSPRVRGKDVFGDAGGNGGGIIPAGAGKSLARGPCSLRSQDHPRGCGEKSKKIGASSSRVGSSPRVRGKVGRNGLRRLGGGDHPRGCGEKTGDWQRRQVAAGSSPRVRGKVRHAPGGEARIGIIPAGAGKRWRQASHSGPRRDHPRGCGEKKSSRVRRVHLRGSSPRVRGKAAFLDGCTSRRGIIPAGAGKSHHRTLSTPPHQDHPRGCGEKPF